MFYKKRCAIKPLVFVAGWLGTLLGSACPSSECLPTGTAKDKPHVKANAQYSVMIIS
jgi:hypothetical protein